eukprot:5171348-Alexandrium_andersonii.AAC.1
MACRGAHREAPLGQPQDGEPARRSARGRGFHPGRIFRRPRWVHGEAVSYTHLTLPTICSV